MIKVSFAAGLLALRIKGMKERRGKQENLNIQIYKGCWREDSIDVRHLFVVVVVPSN